jgi:hypothetical protein
LPVVSYGCETWSLILDIDKEFENRVLRRINGRKEADIRGG